MTELVVRCLSPGEEKLFDSLPDPGLVGFAALGRTFLDMYAEEYYRPQWCFVALRGDTVVARAAWWAGPDDPEPFTLDWFDFRAGERKAGAKLLQIAPFRTEYSLRVPPDWREEPLVRAAAEDRLAAAGAAGMRVLVERYIYRWTPENGIPERPGRLIFRPEPDDGVVFDLLRRIEVGSLDAHSRRAATEYGPYTAAAQELDILLRMPGPRDWWRLAFDQRGEMVGFVAPTRNVSSANVGFVGVLPEHRGQSYGYDLLVEATHLLAAAGADRITAGTDLANRPMAAAFARAGYPVANHRIDLA
jgi:RimJ/RimL family protein N-acetyltransferase